MNRVCTPKWVNTKWKGVVLETMGIPIKELVVKCKWVAWTKPHQYYFKLNTDGSRNGNGTSVGGFVRD